MQLGAEARLGLRLGLIQQTFAFNVAPYPTQLLSLRNYEVSTSATVKDGSGSPVG